MPAESPYWRLAPKGKEICLDCPLCECVYTPWANPDDVCPIDGAIPQKKGKIGKRTQERRERLRLIEHILPDIDGLPTAALLANLTGIPERTLLQWVWKGYIVTKLVKLPKGAQMGRRGIKVIVGVNL